jgi:uncharacterized protein (TIGR03437 family)
LVVTGSNAYAQAPVIEAGGVENTASNITATSVAPQVLITIKGQNLATSTETGSGYPLPTTLGGAKVTLTGSNGPLLAPLLYVSPTQIDAQVPNGITGSSVVVTTAVGSSAPYTIPLVAGTYPYAIGPLGIFTQDTSGCGQAVAYNVHADGSVSLNTPRNSLDPEKDVGLTIFLTGLGGLDFTDRQDGIPWPYNSRDNLAPQLVSSGTSLASLGFGAPGLTASVADLSLTYLGPAPDKVGIDQANAVGHWKGWPQGCKVPMSLTLLQPQVVDNVNYPGIPQLATFVPFTSSQVVDVSIQPGGGVCIDPADSGLGIIAWQKSNVSDVGGTTSTEAVTAQFIQSEGLGFAQPGPQGTPLPPLTFGFPYYPLYGPYASPLPACNASLPNTLDGGTLILSGPSVNTVALKRSNQDTRLTYEAALPPGTLQGGTYQVMGLGGPDVGAFTANANIPAPITIIPNDVIPSLQPGTQLPSPCQVTSVQPISPCNGESYEFTWTGGDDRSIVTVQFIVGNSFQGVASTYGGTGTVSIPSSYGPYPYVCDLLAFGTGCGLLPIGNVEVIITQTSSPYQEHQFNVPGLGWGVNGTWKYVWDFRGLMN